MASNVARREIDLGAGPGDPVNAITVERLGDEEIEVCRVRETDEAASCRVFKAGTPEFNAAELLLLYTEHPEEVVAEAVDNLGLPS